MSAWADARLTMFGEPYMVWHDGPDFTGLRDEWKRDPEHLLDLLFEGMGEDDALAAESFSELDPAPTGALLDRVVAKLKEHLPTSPPGPRTQIARTLFRLTGSLDWVSPILEVLDGSLNGNDIHWSNRIDAAIALRDFPAADFPPDSPAHAALLRNVQAADYLVRYHSATTLLRWAGDTQDISENDVLFTDLVKDDDPAAWARVAAALAKR